ncbi:MAG: GTP cyclohydrolase 1 type 2 [Phycisphaerae bacterium]|nr:GTP cyclohydrolase 1 type 2 [Phycisphaerae bacterium]
MSDAASPAPSVGEALGALDVLCPLRLAAEWDNVGLLAGAPGWPAGRIMLAIDLTDAVAAEALAERVDLLVVYHPPIFKGIRAVTAAAECPTTQLAELLAARVSIVALHTALDHAEGGTNDVLLDVFKPAARAPLEPLGADARQYKLVVFTPPDAVTPVRDALASAGAGVIGAYTLCSFETAGYGTFLGDASTRPAVGRAGQFERAAEVRLEMIVPAARLGAAVRALHGVHPYEEPAVDIHSLRTIDARGRTGSGRVGTLATPCRGDRLVRSLATCVDLSNASIVGELHREFTSVTAAAGAYGVRSFRDPNSLVLTGEFKHHDALALLRAGVTAIHLGHDASERPVLPVLRARLAAALPAACVWLSKSDRSPHRRLTPP